MAEPPPETLRDYLRRHPWRWRVLFAFPWLGRVELAPWWSWGRLRRYRAGHCVAWALGFAWVRLTWETAP